MYYNFATLKNNKEIARAIDSLCELIDDTQDECSELHIKVKQHSDKYFNEYGFYVYSADKRIQLFFGFWFDLWETTGEPLCICVSWDKLKENWLRDKFSKFVAQHTDKLQFIDFQDLPAAVLKDEYVKSLKDGKQTAELVKLILDTLGIQYVKV